MRLSVFNRKRHKIAYDGDMGKVTVTIYMEEVDKEALQQLADAEERSLSQMAVLILRRAIRQAQNDGTITPK
ncbi:ribbon-helix-helix domain-containing protein [Anabaena sp. CCY 9402-a]|uniref:ribbon-helix-helix domain-containing protein n=1 Tax=Anabaena sp. CCY 9402-a TaxID=3103867 RepID=UPI0039C665FF